MTQKRILIEEGRKEDTKGYLHTQTNNSSRTRYMLIIFSPLISHTSSSHFYWCPGTLTSPWVSIWRYLFLPRTYFFFNERWANTMKVAFQKWSGDPSCTLSQQQPLFLLLWKLRHFGDGKNSARVLFAVAIENSLRVSIDQWASFSLAQKEGQKQ